MALGSGVLLWFEIPSSTSLAQEPPVSSKYASEIFEAKCFFSGLALVGHHRWVITCQQAAGDDRSHLLSLRSVPQGQEEAAFCPDFIDLQILIHAVVCNILLDLCTLKCLRITSELFFILMEMGQGAGKEEEREAGRISRGPNRAAFSPNSPCLVNEVT